MADKKFVNNLITNTHFYNNPYDVILNLRYKNPFTFVIANFAMQNSNLRFADKKSAVKCQSLLTRHRETKITKRNFPISRKR